MKNKIKALVVLGILCFVVYSVWTESSHMYTPHTVIHRDGRVWHLKGAPMGHRLNGVLHSGFGKEIMFLHENGISAYVFDADDVTVLCDE